MEYYISEDEPGEIELIFADFRCHFAAYFTPKQFQNFKDIVNKFVFCEDIKTSKIMHLSRRKDGLGILLDQDGKDITLNLSSQSILPLIVWESSEF